MKYAVTAEMLTLVKFIRMLFFTQSLLNIIFHACETKRVIPLTVHIYDLTFISGGGLEGG